ncbi:FecR family protein [Pseudobacter ginsenosidimutans]|uniref:FecR family protein n=1 Tax=Pseudobacter ginsenosidimutans TaxID=661488 RepID=UPI00102DE944|nr:FecR domain-containing protein [Pseudobacter ginsenosidimutans]QEC43246.1 DUF4974 domain-containing protein [Pseudobacter ginsenosidimutans]
MPTHHQQIAALLYRYCSGEPLADEEQSALDNWLLASPANREVMEKLQREDWLQQSMQQWAKMEKEQETDWQSFAGRIGFAEPLETPGIRKMQWTWLKYAAAVLLLLAVGAWLWLSQSEKRSSVTTAPVAVADIKPGKDGALLTLADGSQIRLDSIGNGWQIQENGTTLKMENGKLAYRSGNGSELAYNTISTPNGRQFHVQLPDGSHVWLNAASSLTYPTSFNGNKRQVQITGEVYFDVAPNPKQPFMVQVDASTSVEVLGTVFNVNAYANETVMRTTLVEGSIRIKAGQEQVLLQPGQQALYQQGKSTGIRIVEADTEQELAWKNGFFNFNNEDIPAFLRQLERWYDIHVIIDGTIPSMKFKGGLDRNTSLSEILKVLSKLNIPYRLEGKTLSVGNK